jgi:hypothetical protein
MTAASPSAPWEWMHSPMRPLRWGGCLLLTKNQRCSPMFLAISGGSHDDFWAMNCEWHSHWWAEARRVTWDLILPLFVPQWQGSWILRWLRAGWEQLVAESLFGRQLHTLRERKINFHVWSQNACCVRVTRIRTLTQTQSHTHTHKCTHRHTCPDTHAQCWLGESSHWRINTTQRANPPWGYLQTGN